MHKCLLFFIFSLFLFLFPSCDEDDRDKSDNTITYDAVVGETIRLDKLLFPKLAEQTEAAIEEKWNEIDEIYNTLDTYTLPEDFIPTNICENIASVTDPALLITLTTACEELSGKIEEISNLQEAVNYGADYLWNSNNESIALVNGEGLALATQEGTATIIVTDTNGNEAFKINLNVSKYVKKIKVLQFNNEAFVTIEDGYIRSYNADESIKNELSVTVSDYDPETGNVTLTGDGSSGVVVGQTVFFSPSDDIPDGAMREVTSITVLSANSVQLDTVPGNLSNVVENLDLEYKESTESAEGDLTDTPDEEETETKSIQNTADTDLYNLNAFTSEMRKLSKDEFRQNIINSERGQSYLQLSEEDKALSQDLLVRGTIDGDWSPSHAYEFNKTYYVYEKEIFSPWGTRTIKIVTTEELTSPSYTFLGTSNVSGTIGFNMPIHLYLYYKSFKMQRFKAWFKPTQFCDITVRSDGYALEAERTLKTFYGPVIKFFIGPIPVTVRPVIGIGIGTKTEGDAVTLKIVDYEVSYKCGVDYKRGREGSDWQPISESSKTFYAPEIEEADFTVSGWGYIKPKLRFWEMGGPYAITRIGAKLTADTSKTGADENWASLNGFLKVNLGFEFEVDYLGIDYDKDFGRVVYYNRTVWDSDGPYIE